MLQAQVTQTKLTMVTMVGYSSLFSHSASSSRKLGVEPPLLSPLLNRFKAITPLILLSRFKAISPLSPLLNRFKAILPLILLSQFSPLILISWFKAISSLIILRVFYETIHFYLSSRQTGPLLFLSPETFHLAIQLYLFPSQVGLLFSSFVVFNFAILHLRFKTGPSLWFKVPFILAILSSSHLNDPFSPRFLRFYVLFIAATHSFLHANGSLLPLLLWLKVVFARETAISMIFTTTNFIT